MPGLSTVLSRTHRGRKAVLVEMAVTLLKLFSLDSFFLQLFSWPFVWVQQKGEDPKNTLL